MTMVGVVGTVDGLWRFPVKSMGGERVEEAEVTQRGLVGDRAYALIDTATGRIVSAKNVKMYPDLLGCRAVFVEPPRSGGDLPAARITLADGATVRTDAKDVDRVLSAFFRRDVTLAHTVREDFAVDGDHPGVDGGDPGGHRDSLVERKLGPELFAETGLSSPVPVGAFVDAFPVSLLTTSTLEQLDGLQPETRFDARRFRMNLIVRTGETGFVENGWIGRQLAIGDRVRLGLALPDPRCVMTTLAQQDLPEDTGVLDTLARHNMIRLGAAGRQPCAGAYAVVTAPGTMRTGDRVALG